MRSSIILPLAGAAFAVTGWWVWSLGQNDDLEAGRVLYAENCASCHGANLEGQPDWQIAGEDGILPAPPHNETGHTWHHGDVLLFDYIKLGGAKTLAQMGIQDAPSGMPGFEDSLSDSEIRQIIDFIKSTWSDRERLVQEEATKTEQIG